MLLRRVSEPLNQSQKASVVGLAMAKAHLRILHGDEDGILEEMLAAAYDYLSGPDGWLNGYCILKERFELTVGRIGRDPLPLEARPYAGGVAIERRGEDGAYAVVDQTVYDVGFNSFYAVIGIFGPAILSPIAYRSDPAAFRIQFDAGHTSADQVPSPIKMAMKMLAGHWFANREATTSDNRAIPTKVELGLRALCRPYRVTVDHS